MGTKGKSNGSVASNVLDFATIVAAGKTKVTTVHIEELGGDVNLKGMSALDVIDFAANRGEGEDDKGKQHEAMLALIAKAVVDADGDPIFDTPKKLEELQSLNFKVYTALAAAVTKNAGLVSDAVEVPKGSTEADEKGKD